MHMKYKLLTMAKVWTVCFVQGHLQLRGILNGIDYNVYNPETDDKIFQKYTIKNFEIKKAENKLKLQEELGLPQDKNKFMIAIISRLTDQKGLDLVNNMIERIADKHTQFVVLGTGEAKYENTFKHFQWKYPDRVSANIYFSDERAHRIYAAADAMLVPSRFEPCGLTQLIALRYGTIPIVRETAVLKIQLFHTMNLKITVPASHLQTTMQMIC